MSMGAVIHIIDSDAQRCESMRDRLATKLWVCHTFRSVADFLDEHQGNERGCVVFAVEPNIDGPITDMGLSATLQSRNDDLPVIMLVNESQALGIAQAIRGGAYDCLALDTSAKELRASVTHAIEEYDIRNQARAIMFQLESEMVHMTHEQCLLVDWLRANLTPHAISKLMRRVQHNGNSGSNGHHNGHSHHDGNGNGNGNGYKSLEAQGWMGFAVEQINSLSPRVRQTLDLLLTGYSEKQIAAKLNISRHTVHGYVKTLHTKLQVSSRGELLAKCLGTYQSEVQFEESAVAK